MDALKAHIRNIPDFPKPGVMFRDITPLLQDASAFRTAITEMANQVKDMNIDRVVAIESRGFIFGSAIAIQLGAGLSLVRKPKKLPYRTTKIEYALEYGIDTLEMHVDAVAPTDRVLIVDDVLATGGTAQATARLVESAGGKVLAIAFLSELAFLKGRERLKDYPIVTLMTF